MSRDASEMKPAPTPEEIDEAAVWIARLHAPSRTLQVERGFRRWLTESPSHAAAFETVSTGWELSGMLERRPFPRLNRWQRAGFREGFVHATTAVAATVALFVGALVLHQIYSDEVKTSVGEQRTVTLEDGSRMTLNTATRVAVQYDEHARRIELKSGEALFEVTKQERPWPFIVSVGDRTITAVGTAFVVRADARETSVFMVEGEVVVAPSSAAQQAAPMPQPLTMGQRLTFASDGSGAAPMLDQPNARKVIAWRWGQVELEDTPLAAAVEEMNRYSAIKLSVATLEARRIRINGIFRTGDTANFAVAVAETYGLTVVSSPNAIVLEGRPAVANEVAL